MSKRKTKNLTKDEIHSLGDFERLIYCTANKGSVQSKGECFYVQVRVGIETRAFLDLVKERVGASHAKTVAYVLREKIPELLNELEMFGGELGEDAEEAYNEKIRELCAQLKEEKKAC